MSSALAAQVCRIVAPEKLPDRFLTSGVFTHAEHTQLQDQVILAYVFEVNQPMFASSNLLEHLLATLQEEHGHLSTTGNLDDQFELLLRNVNQQLNAISESGETDWIGNLNGLIMVMTGEELHFAQTGRCPAYLLQNNRIRQITDDSQADREPHPLKTFSNLASGHLGEGDQLLIANQELYQEISLDALRRLIHNCTPYEASQAIARELKKEKNAAVTSIILRISPEPLTEEPTELSLEQEMESGFAKLRRHLTPLAAAAKQFSVTTAQQTGTLVKEKVAPKASELLQKGAASAKELSKQVATRKEKTPVVEIILPTAVKATEAGVIEQAAETSNFESVIPANEFALDSTVPVENTEEHTVNLPNILDFLSQGYRSILSSFKSWISIPRNKKIAALVLAGVLIVSTIWGATKQRTEGPTPQASAQNEQILEEVENATTSIATAIDLQQNIEAANSIEDAQRKILSLKDPSSGQREKADELWDQILVHADTLSKTTRLTTPSDKATFTGEVQGLLTQLPYFYGWGRSTPSLLRTGKGEPSVVNKTIALADTNDAIISAARSTENDEVTYALTRQNKVYRIVQTGATTDMRTVSTKAGPFDIGDAISSYASNIYILDGKTGLLWRYLNSGNGVYNNRESVIDTTRYDIRKSISLAIDGSIYILKQDGSLMKFNRGVQDPDFKLKDQPQLSQTLIQPLQVITNEGTSSIYILDGGNTVAGRSTAKVLEFDKKGSFIRQYAFPKEAINVKSFDINAKEKKMWILNGSDVLEFDI